MKIIPIDCHYVEAEFAGAYLLVHEGKGFFVECNTNYAIPYLLKAAKSEGLSINDIDGLLITHVHLDHAGGAGLFLKEFPNAKLFAHPRAARHAIDPTKLVGSAAQVYGANFMKRMYGEILPCPESRVVQLQDGGSISFQGVELKTKWLEGHAKHHLVMEEPITKTCFTGDSFGVSYPKLNEKHGLVIIPSTSPTDFNGDAAIEAVKWIAAQGFKRLAPTHYGFIEEKQIKPAAELLCDQLNYSKALVQQIREQNLSIDAAELLLSSFTQYYFEKKGILLSEAELKHLKIDLSVNAQGLHWRALNP